MLAFCCCCCCCCWFFFFYCLVRFVNIALEFVTLMGAWINWKMHSISFLFFAFFYYYVLIYFSTLTNCVRRYLTFSPNRCVRRAQTVAEQRLRQRAAQHQLEAAAGHWVRGGERFFSGTSECGLKQSMSISISLAAIELLNPFYARTTNSLIVVVFFYLLFFLC